MTSKPIKKDEVSSDELILQFKPLSPAIEFENEVLRTLRNSSDFITGKQICSNLSCFSLRKVTIAIEALRKRGLRIIADRSKGYKLGTEKEWNEYDEQSTMIAIKQIANVKRATKQQMLNIIEKMEF